jgi:hypothetical protein
MQAYTRSVSLFTVWLDSMFESSSSPRCKIMLLHMHNTLFPTDQQVRHPWTLECTSRFRRAECIWLPPASAHNSLDISWERKLKCDSLGPEPFLYSCTDCQDTGIVTGCQWSRCGNYIQKRPCSNRICISEPNSVFSQDTNQWNKLVNTLIKFGAPEGQEIIWRVK